MPLFHYALKPGGLLVLGSSESVGDFVNLFAPVARKERIYQRKAHDFGPHGMGILSWFPTPPGKEIVRRAGIGTPSDNKLPLQAIAERTLLEHYSPVGALVSERGDILYLLGRTGRYLEPTPGEASLNIFRMAREGLRGDLTIALHRAVSLGISARHTGLRVKSDDTFTTVDLTVLPVPGDTEGAISRALFLVILEEKAAVDPRISTEVAVDAAEGVATLGP